jgi:ketosteroid isomerase-like protein
MTSQHIQRVIDQFENLSPNSIDALVALYSKDAFFKDPFNEVKGHAHIKHIFSHMFTQVNNPHFVIKNTLDNGSQAYLIWEFIFQLKQSSEINQVIRGCTWMTFNEELLITEHRDYWDAAEELYEKIPVLGALMRWLKKRARE